MREQIDRGHGLGPMSRTLPGNGMTRNIKPGLQDVCRMHSVLPCSGTKRDFRFRRDADVCVRGVLIL